jgi:NADH-quinone oxidoreductase subunit G
LRGGDIGSRIFGSDLDREALRAAAGIFPGASIGSVGVPPAFAKRADALLVLPRRHTFGSEELSARSPVLASRIPEPRLFLSVVDAGRLGLAEGKLAEIRFQYGAEEGSQGPEAAFLVLPVTVADLPEGVASLPWGLPALPGAPLSAWAAVRPLPEEVK